MSTPFTQPRHAQQQAVRKDDHESWRQEWLQLLPREWRDSVVEVFDFSEHREYEIHAWRKLGRDVDGKLCYCAHCYAVDALRSDDDEEFYGVIAYGELVHAWRLRDDRWLIYRVVQGNAEHSPQPNNRGFYSFASEPPA